MSKSVIKYKAIKQNQITWNGKEIFRERYHALEELNKFFESKNCIQGNRNLFDEQLIIKIGLNYQNMEEWIW